MKSSTSKAAIDRAAHISARQFKATCPNLMDDIARTGRDIVVTKHGQPVIRVSAAAQHVESPWGFLRGSIVRHGDIATADDAAWALSATDPLSRNTPR